MYINQKYVCSLPQNPWFRKSRFKGGKGKKMNIGGGGLGYRERPGLGADSSVRPPPHCSAAAAHKHRPTLSSVGRAHCAYQSSACCSFTFMAFGRRFYPKRLTISTLVRIKRNNIFLYIYCSPPIVQALTIARLNHSLYTTKIARIRFYTMLSTIFKFKDVQHTISA